MMRAIVAFMVVATLVDGVFLAPPTNSTKKADDGESEESIDAQIAALNGQLGGLKDKVADTAKEMNVTYEDDFTRHCKKEDKAELDNMKDEDIEPKKQESKAKPQGKAGAVLTVFESQMEASNQKSRMDNQAFL